MSRGMRNLRLMALAVGLIAVAGATAQSRPGMGGTANPDAVAFSIDAARGRDRAVDYAALARLGPWDDRNYQLTREDLALLSPNEADASIPIPAFYRVEMRRANPNLLKVGPAQYPRSALNGYLAKYQGYTVNGTTYRRLEANGAGGYDILRNNTAAEAEYESRYGALPNFLGGEKRITTPAGAAESAIAINPVNTNLVIAGTNGPGSGQKMWRSSDGGVTWSGPISLSNTCCDPTVGWSPDGTVGYASALSTVVGSGTNVLFYRSSDNGASWNLSSTLSTGNVSDKEYLHVDMHATSPHKGNVYVAWHENNVQKFNRSTNGGVSFGTKQTLDGSGRGIGSDITSDTAGNVYFFYPAVSGGTTPKTIRMSKSTNGGSSFAAATTVANTNADFDFPIPSMETRRAFVYVSADTDRSGGTYNNTIYASWTDSSATTSNSASANHARIQVAYSRNGGSSWTITTPHPTADINTVDRFNHWLTVDRTGRVFVMYYDTRHSSGRTGTDVYYSVSTNGGQTWSAGTRLTTVTSRNITDSFEWGDYNGLDMAINDIVAIYTDNRDEAGGTAQSIDVYGIGGFAGSGGNVAPTANFSFTTSSLTANFTDSSSDSDGTIASRSWNFGDGTTSTATNPSKTYAASGTYNVQLTVTDNGGLTNSITRAVTVTSTANTPPVANFTFTTSGLTANFTDSSTDANGTIASRAWNFGDGTTSSATNPAKTYSAAGTYNVQLTATDNQGATNSITKSVTVSAPPPNTLTNGVPVTGLSGATGAELRYTMVVPAGASGLKFVIAGGTGDADLYVRFGSAPTTSTYDCRPYLSGNSETCNIATAQAGTYHVMVRAYTAFSGVSLTGSYTTGGQQSFFENQTDFTISDNTTVESPIAVTRSGNAPSTLAVGVTIFHTYRGDLVVSLIAPDGSSYMLSNRWGGSADNIIQTFTVNASSEVAQGTWKLRVRDAAGGDVGRIDKWSLQF